MSSELSFSSKRPTALVLLEDGNVFYGKGFGAAGKKIGEICFNTSMTGYQEIMTDPSYAGQIINFTFPHIGNTGTNEDDLETVNPYALGMIVREDPTAPSNWRATKPLADWMKTMNLIGVCGVDTRTMTRFIRDHGAPKGAIVHDPSGVFDLPALLKEIQEWPGLDGLDLAKDVSCTQSYIWTDGLWDLTNGYQKNTIGQTHVVAVDFGAKRNILRCLVGAGCRVTVVPATATADEIMAHKPDGVFLSNGPGDPAATGIYAVPMIRDLMIRNVPIFGICLGHQLLALALGAKTQKMHLGHRGANHPVKDLNTGLVEITSQNHGFAVLEDTLPDNVQASHISLFDGSNEGLIVRDYPAFSVQYHPEASPGPQDSYYLFERFKNMIQTGSPLALS
ncbi:MAG: glutamine-hydrolyzing carbamoyl-phosphate synthase small subunit [Rhodospirillales bacterium]|nr:glutamine-hydrolyzing carbamoyl-phosphate synthase small subunit [Rhodospirillales bacterium]MCB9980462.1 glutamine-hydrolyzing carbamoyl-phosphate synthase small subunit [Rhodospirillales bacterium]